MMLRSSSTSLSLLLVVVVLGVVVCSVAAQDATLCELGQAGCMKKNVDKKGKKKNKEHQQPALANNNNNNNNNSSSVKQINNDTLLPRTLVNEEDEESAANNPQEVHVNNHHHTTTQFDLSPPPLLKEEEEDPTFFPLLQERIASIQAYLQDPMFYLIDMDVDSYMHQADLSSYSIPPSNLVAILEDLEFQLEKGNVTLAHEFYALGGWHLVASLVSPVAHGVAVSSSDHDDNHNHHINADVNDKILVIRAYATSLLGAIIKSNSRDDNDVASWVIAPVQIDDAHDMTTMRTTPLNLVAQAMVEVSASEDAASAVPAVVQQKCSDNTIEYQHQLAKECMHTLDAFLNHGGGNAHAAHVAFSTLWTVVTPSSTSSSTTSSTTTVEEESSSSTSSSSSSPAKILGHQVAIWTQQAATTAADTESSNAPMSRHSIDMATRLLRLAKDIVQDVDNLQQQQQQDNDNDENKIILNVLSTNDWCHSAMQAATLTPSTSFKRLVFTSLQKAALQALAKLGPHCSHYFHQDRHDNDNSNDDKPPHAAVGVADLIRLHEQVVLQADSDRSSSSSKKRVVDGGQKEREREFMQLVEEALAAVTPTDTTTTTTTTTTTASSILLPPGVVNEE